MSDLPSSSPQGQSASESSPNDLLQLGLAVLKQKDYARAVQYLSKVSQDRAATGATRLKARVALVKALHGQGQTEAAIALAQKLTTHPQAKVQQWAKNTLAQWQASPTPKAQSTPSPTDADVSGFQPLVADSPPAEPTSPMVKTEASSPSAPQDLSGFQPLEATTPAAQPSEYRAVNRSQSPTAADATGSSSPPSDAVHQPPTASAAVTSSNAAEPPDQAEPPSELLTPRSSLFHYEQLNQWMPTEGDSDAGVSPREAPAWLEEDASAIADSTGGDTAELLQFQYSGRLPRLRALPPKQPDKLQVWLIQAVSAIALFWLCRAAIQWGLSQIARFLDLFDFLPIPLGWRYEAHTWLVLFGLIGLLLASPWLLDWLFRQTAGLKPLSIQTLQKSHPEGCRLMRRIAQQRGWLLPLLRELPTDTPLIFSYGWLPRYNRIVVSRGLLAQLDDQEVATLIGYELNHFTSGTVPYMSLVAVLLQGFYQGYWQIAHWGDRHSDRMVKTLAAAGSTLCYTVYWLVRKLHLPLSRTRVILSDRQAVEWTGNPNALTRALIKLAQGNAESIAQLGQTPPLLESTDLLTPSGYEETLTPGSIFPDASFLDVLQWDIYNPYRRWLSINASHTRLGDRLQRLTAYALRWQLTPEIPFPPSTPLPTGASHPTFWERWVPFLQQISPYIGPILGIVVAMGLWFVGGIFEPLGFRRIGWVYGDRSVLWGSLLLGLGMGIMVRINPYFPDITITNRRANPPLPDLLNDSMALPTDSRPVRLEGRLLGRRGIANWLCQDFILETSSGLLKLHFLSILGAFGNLFIHPHHPTEWLGRTIEAQGWGRRGVKAWLDIETFLKSGRVVIRANHPMWSVLLSLLFCGLGLLILLRG